MSEKLILLFTTDVYSLDVSIQSELYNEFYRLVYDMVLYIVKDHASAEDVIQEAFIKSLKHPPRYTDAKKIDGWLKTLTRNTALNYFRKMKKMRDELNVNSVYIEGASALYNPYPSIERQVEGKMTWEDIVDEITLLKPEYRQVLELKYIHDLTYNEIAEVTGVTEGAVRQRLARSRDSVKNNLKRKWGDGNEE